MTDDALLALARGVVAKWTPRLYARGFATGVALFEPDRVIPLPDGVAPQVVLLHKGYEG